ncbi:hypothetical protein DL767_001157 [Monosporascus sp. MG133]|nr:hypothetical protein DL767_001157 [Monosporascus sp. MG133]
MSAHTGSHRKVHRLNSKYAANQASWPQAIKCQETAHNHDGTTEDCDFAMKNRHLMLAHYRRDHGLEGKRRRQEALQELPKKSHKYRATLADIPAASLQSASRKALLNIPVISPQQCGWAPAPAAPILLSLASTPLPIPCAAAAAVAATSPPPTTCWRVITILERFSSATRELCRCGEEMMLKLRASPSFRLWVKGFQDGKGFAPAIGNMEFPFRPRYQEPLSPPYEGVQGTGDFRHPGRPDRLDQVVAPSYGTAACEHAALDDEEHEVPSVWGTDVAEEKEAWVRCMKSTGRRPYYLSPLIVDMIGQEGKNADRSQRVLQEILAMVQTQRTIKTPLKMPDGGTSYPRQDLPLMRVVMKELRYGKNDAKELRPRRPLQQEATGEKPSPRPLTAVEASDKGGILTQNGTKFLCNSGAWREIEKTAKDVASAFPIASFFPLTPNRTKFLCNDGKCREIKNIAKDVASHLQEALPGGQDPRIPAVPPECRLSCPPV